MSHVWLPCGLYHQEYTQDHGWWQTPLIKGKMIFLLAIIFIVFPLTLTGDLNLIQFVIPGLTEPAPYLIRGNPVFFWIPASAGMACAAMN